MRIKLTITLVHQRFIEKRKPANTQIKFKLELHYRKRVSGKI